MESCYFPCHLVYQRSINNRPCGRPRNKKRRRLQINGDKNLRSFSSPDRRRAWSDIRGNPADCDSACQPTLCGFVCFVGCLTSQQHASVSQGRICSDKFTCCHTEIEVADPTFRLTQSQYTDTGPTSPSADPITPGAWQGSHWSASF